MFFKGKKKAERAAIAAAIAAADERALARIILKCDGKLERVVKYILAAVDEQETCKFCEARSAGDCESVGTCAPAVAAYLRERDGHA